MRTLVFEGMGLPHTIPNNIDNCRIRTCFLDNNQKPVFLELEGWGANKSGTRLKIEYYKRKRVNAGFVGSAFYISEDQPGQDLPVIRDVITSSGYKFSDRIDHSNWVTFRYTEDGIKKFINEIFKVQFDAVRVVNEGYRVINYDHQKRCTSYNLGDMYET